MPPSGQASGKGDNNDLPNPTNKVERTLQLTRVRDWCIERLSDLSMENRLSDARAITSEHLELLEKIDAHTTLWMIIEKTKP